ncbi:SUN domain-containing protein 3-like [Meleagris gallopavo]|uniref:SUN domain-containing protein 3-like n=1 Tax=Meleagris gallopavo TaxID=9103 RepID=UPI00093D6C3F|nr:SUN domain-containing protein 3-like [Meleagris gallopavo]
MRVCLCCGAEPMGQYTSRAPDAGAGISAGGSFAHEHCFFFSFQPDNHPGNCWPFPGSQGHVFMMLPRAIFPTAVTLTHGIPANAYHADSISSAPKDFAVYGLQEKDDEGGTLLGEFTFTPGQTPSQTFQLKNEHSGLINYVKLQVLSNWGHLDYTCVYQFRLHGNPAHDDEDKGKLYLSRRNV